MMETNDIVRKVATEMLNTSMQDITAERIHGWATRLGATCKESLQVRNATKMREALEAISRMISFFKRGEALGLIYVHNIKIIVDEALAEPLRNCDVGTAEEQAIRFEAYCDSHANCAHCPLKGQQCVLAWSQMPYEEVKK